MTKPSTKKESKALAEHFFRLEYSKMVSVITRYFGLNNINLAEDIVQDTLLEAINSWEFKGIPENPRAWLYKVAKNKALNALKKLKSNDDYLSRQPPILTNEVGDIFSEEHITDDQLRMMFACCHPSISQDAQVSLMLKTLCGLSITEISKAFLTTNETINKRLVRARKVLREGKVKFEIPNPEVLDQRLETVLKAIFLLFNEGYSASKGDYLIRYDLCLESIRLVKLICNSDRFTPYSSPSALLALMMLNASRFKARIDQEGNMVRMVHQDRSLWDQRLIANGIMHLNKVNHSKHIGIYHILATISAYHCTAKDYDSTNWKGILEMYDALVGIDSSPLARFNRAIALAKVEGPEPAIKTLISLEPEIPDNYHLFHSTLADFYFQLSNYQNALDRLKIALSLVSTNSEKRIIEKRITSCQQKLK